MKSKIEFFAEWLSEIFIWVLTFVTNLFNESHLKEMPQFVVFRRFYYTYVYFVSVDYVSVNVIVMKRLFDSFGFHCVRTASELCVCSKLVSGVSALLLRYATLQKYHYVTVFF